MSFGAHTDFTQVTIIDADTGVYSLRRVDPTEHRCESCTMPAEYIARWQGDVHGQCEAAQCQDCLVEQSRAVMSPDEFVVNP